jgi:hypothetical protein
MDLLATMNDTQRMDWLEREPERWVCRKENGKWKFRVLIERKPGLLAIYSDEYDTLREAVDEGMKRVL